MPKATARGDELEESIQEQIPYNVSEWKRIGIERGYWDYFRDEVRKEVLEEIEKVSSNQFIDCAERLRMIDIIINSMK